jgi:hypothetical protein
MYKIFMVIALSVLAIAWIAYLLWQRRQDKLEQSQPKKSSHRLEKSRGEVADWAQKMAAYKPPKPTSDGAGDHGAASS